MKRLSSLSNQLKTNHTNLSQTKNTLIEELIEKTKIIFPHLIIPTWILSPLVCLYLMKIGSFETRLNLFLFLIYQYFFVKDTKFLREILFQMKGAEYFKDYKIIIEDDQEILHSHSLFTFHPHGYFATGLYLCHLTNETIKNNVIVGSRMALYYPWGGIIMKYMGVNGANPENFELLMRSGRNISLVPGGFEESTLTQYGKQRVFLKNRKGFIKMALKHGYKVYPVYTIGETNMLYSLRNEKLGLILNKIKLPGTLPYSRNVFLANNNEELITIIGKKIDLPKKDNPTQEDIDYYHNLYVENLKRMYSKYKRDQDENLEIL